MDVYLDHNATTPPHPEVVDAVVECMTDAFGNAASSHIRGRSTAARIADARDAVASLVGVAASRVVWTSGATEGLNTAIRAAVETHPHLLVAATEHKAVLDVVTSLADSDGLQVTWLDVTEDGQVTPEALNRAVADSPFTLIAMAANNETGVLNDVAALTELAHRHDGIVVCDATQQVGKLPVDLDLWGVDYATVSAHKLRGPQGVGALIVPPRTTARPLIRGGGHQHGWRSGTLNAPGIVGFGVAATLASEEVDATVARIAKLRDRLLTALKEALGPVEVNGAGAPRLPNTLNVQIPGVDADALIVNCPEVAFASGSACTSAVPTPSHVLTAMGVEDARAEESVRLSLGSTTSQGDIDLAAKALTDAALRIRDLMGEA